MTLPGRLAARLITALRHGQALDEAAAQLGVDLRAVWVRARTDTRLAVALARPAPAAHPARTISAHPQKAAARAEARKGG